MRILDKYILKNVFFSYLFLLLVFIGLHILIDLFSTLSDILENKPPLAIIAQYYLFYFPLIIIRVSPMALLMSALYNYSNFGKNNEITSMRSSGISALRTASPVIFLALFISTAVFFLQEKILMESQSQMEKIKSQYIEQESKEAEIQNLAFSSDQAIFFSEVFFPGEEKLKNVIIFKQDSQGTLTKKLRIDWLNYQNGKWVGSNVIEYSLKSAGRLDRFPVQSSKKDILLSKTPRELTFEQSKFLEFSSLERLRNQIVNLENVGASSLLTNLRVEFHKKIAFPFSHLFLIIGSLPIALEIKKKKAAFAAIGIGLLFSLLYSLMDAISLALGKSEIILPFFAAWVAPLFFLSIGITGLLLMR